MADSGGGGAMERVEPIGPWGAVFVAVFGAGMVCFGGLGVLALVGEILDDPAGVGWGSVGLGVIALAPAFFAVLGLSAVETARRQRRDTRRLYAGGVAATAEILEVGPRDVRADASAEFRLRIRVSGPGFTPFESVYIARDRFLPHPAVGMQLDAHVNTAAGLYTT